MDLQQIDKNFKVITDITEPDIVWYNVRQAPFTVYGLMYDDDMKMFLRFPKEASEKVSPAVANLNRDTAGGRVRFRTNSSYIAIRSIMTHTTLDPHMPATGKSGFDLYRRVGEKDTYLATFIPPRNIEDGYSSGTKTCGELTDYTINFPLYDRVFDLYVGIKKDAVLETAAPYKTEKPVVFYGSSITQGGCASRPGNSYQAILSRRLSMNFVNLGFSGSGKGEKTMAEYIATLDMTALVMDYDSNASSVAALDETYYPFYKTVRDAHPDLPIIFISHVDAVSGLPCFLNGDPEEWGTFDERREAIMRAYKRAKAEGDDNIYFVDGREVFKGEEWDACTVDGIHPNDLGFHRFAMYLEKVLKPLL